MDEFFAAVAAAEGEYFDEYLPELTVRAVARCGWGRLWCRQRRFLLAFSRSCIGLCVCVGGGGVTLSCTGAHREAAQAGSERPRGGAGATTRRPGGWCMLLDVM